MTSDSIGFLSIEGLHRAIVGAGKPSGHCDACFSGNYPVAFNTDAASNKRSLPLATL